MIIFFYDDFGHRKGTNWNATKEEARRVVATHPGQVILSNTLLGPIVYNSSSESRVKGTQFKAWDEIRQTRK